MSGKVLAQIGLVQRAGHVDAPFRAGAVEIGDGDEFFARQRIGFLQRRAAPVRQPVTRLVATATARDAIGIGEGEQQPRHAGIVVALFDSRCSRKTLRQSQRPPRRAFVQAQFEMREAPARRQRLQRFQP